jgi:hypothetical protein
MKNEDQSLDDEALLNIDFLMVDGELRSQQRDNSSSQRVVAELGCEETMNAIQLDSVLDLQRDCISLALKPSYHIQVEIVG